MARRVNPLAEIRTVHSSIDFELGGAQRASGLGGPRASGLRSADGLRDSSVAGQCALWWRRLFRASDGSLGGALVLSRCGLRRPRSEVRTDSLRELGVSGFSDSSWAHGRQPAAPSSLRLTALAAACKRGWLGPRGSAAGSLKAALIATEQAALVVAERNGGGCSMLVLGGHSLAHQRSREASGMR